MSEGDLQKNVGRYLRTYRLERALSQEAFAEVVGVHRTYMGGLERGERNLTLKSVERIAERLGVGALEMLVADPKLSHRKSLSLDQSVQLTSSSTM